MRQPRIRPTTTQRGYGSKHQALRRQWKPIVESGDAHCVRCGGWIHPDEPWDLGHDDHDRQIYRGPEHQKCNRGAPNKAKPFRSSRVW